MARRTRDDTPGREETAAERRVLALELRKDGFSYREIGRKLGVSEAQAHRDIARSLAQLREREDGTAEEHRALDLERLDTLLLGLSSYSRVGHVGAVLATLKVLERRARLLGLDAPAKIAPTDPSGEHEYSGLDLKAFSDDELRSLIERARGGRGEGAGAAPLSP